MTRRSRAVKDGRTASRARQPAALAKVWFFPPSAYDAGMKKPSAPTPAPAPPRRRRRPHPLGMAAAAVVRPIIGRKGFVEADLLTRWETIAGPETAALSRPVRLAKPRDGGAPVLHLRVASSAFATLLKHQEPELCARINRYFGFDAVARIKVAPGTLPPPPAPAAPPPPKPPLSTEEAALVAGIDDADLRAALESLGRSIRAGNRAGG